jgi:tripartite-type tricarboxylate transporter receptor subunit TctC
MPMLRRAAALAALVAATSLAGGNLAAQLLSSRPITVIIPFTPGASSDLLQRLVAKKVTENTGQVLIVESRPGGGGSIGAVAVKQAQPDGHTLFQANAGTHAANVALYPTLAYDPVKDFRPITLMWGFPQLLAVPADSPAKSVADLVALAKSKPGGLSFASQGTGAGGHLLGEMLKQRTGTPLVHVPYRGAGPAAVDLAAGRVDFFFVAYASVVSFLQAGKVRVLAVTSPKRLPAQPNVPTMAEAGFPGIQLDAWFGRHARRRDRQAAWRVLPGGARSRHHQDHDRPGRRGYPLQHPGGVRGVHRLGDRAIRQDRAGRRGQGRMTAAYGSMPGSGAQTP